MKYTYIATMVNGENVEFDIEGESELQRNIRCRSFLQNLKDNEGYLIDKKSGIEYNKNHILKVKLKE